MVVRNTPESDWKDTHLIVVVKKTHEFGASKSGGEETLLSGGRKETLVSATGKKHPGKRNL